MATIDTNMSLVMIDPNEPLELYDGTIIKGRLEWFLYALCCLDYGNLPTPLSRIEEWANALITNELPNMEPQSRAEEFFKAILTGDTSNLPTPQSRSEVLLDKLARGENDFTNVEKIQSRYEFLLAYLIKNGGGIGNIDYVLYKFQKEDETLYNTKERPVKSAILTGQTLVNLVNQENRVYSLTADGSYKMIHIPLRYDITDTTKKFFLSFRVVTNTIEPQYTNFGLFATEKYNYCGLNATLTGGKIGQQLVIQQLSKSANHLRVYINNNIPSGTLAVTDIMLIEYQEGMENWDIPYFEGMQSVRMPVLTTSNEDGTKTNILSCNEDVELGSVGEVKDELNLLTKQLTQRTETRPYQEGDELNSEVITDMTNTRYKLPKESIKTVDLSIVDQGGATIPKLKTFDKITHVNVSATDILPGVEMEVATTIGEDLSGTLYSSMEDIETKQEALKESNNAQTESINSTMMATTEIYESLL